MTSVSTQREASTPPPTWQIRWCPSFLVSLSYLILGFFQKHTPLHVFSSPFGAAPVWVIWFSHAKLFPVLCLRMRCWEVGKYDNEEVASFSLTWTRNEWKTMNAGVLWWTAQNSTWVVGKLMQLNWKVFPIRLFRSYLWCLIQLFPHVP